MRTSGAPSWAVSLGLGTEDESQARPVGVKVVAWLLWSAVVTGVLAIYGALDPTLDVTAEALAQMAAIGSIVVFGVVGGVHLLRRFERRRTASS